MFSRVLSAVAIVVLAVTIHAQTTTFTYQGSLRTSGNPANGSYDFEFKLFDLVSNGTQQGSTIQRLNVPVTNGIFTVTLDFGAGVLPGADRFLEIGVRVNGNPGGFQQLLPRQPIASSPYSIRSLNTASADSVAVAGIPAGSGNYIQNQNAAAQPSSSFRISGDGTVGGTLHGNVVNAGTQYNIFGNRILSNPGSANLFAGVNAGLANTTGSSNSFFGGDAGKTNFIGSANAFFGFQAGLNNGGSENSFFGPYAGEFHGNGSGNTFLGRYSGVNSSTGNYNIAIGYNSGFTADGFSFATAIGTDALASASNQITLGRGNGADTVRIPGPLNVTGTMTGNGSGLTNLDASQFTTGILPVGRGGTGLGAPGSLGNFLRSDGTNWVSAPLFGESLPQDSPYYVQTNPFDVQPGSFSLAGNGFVQGVLGAQSFYMDGDNVLSGFRNDGNLWVGSNSRPFCFPISCTGTQQTHVGVSSGIADNGVGNTFVGNFSGQTQSTSSGNLSAFGYMAVTGLTSGNATAIGARSKASCSDCVVLGSVDGQNGATSTVNVGIGVTNPAARLHVAGTIYSSSGGFKFPDGSIQLTAAGTGTTYTAHRTDTVVLANGYGTTVHLDVPTGYYALMFDIAVSTDIAVGRRLVSCRIFGETSDYSVYLTPDNNYASISIHSVLNLTTPNGIDAWCAVDIGTDSFYKTRRLTATRLTGNVIVQ